MQTTNYVADPGRIADLARRIREGELSPADLVRGCLDRMKVTEPVVEAWREVCADTVLAEAEQRAKEVEDGLVRGPLHGIPVGIKDIIDVAGVPTRCNSSSRADAAPATADAEIVSALRAAGAVILGKTHTTEFAYFDPAPTRNPHNPEHTPGGSSSGSAAAVAAGEVPLSLGTQTMGSVNRPAAYCGIAAFKPSTHLLSTFGVAPLSPLWDTVGFFGWSVEDACTAFSAICPPFARRVASSVPEGECRIAVLEDPLTEDASKDVSRALAAAAKALAGSGHAVEPMSASVSFSRLLELHSLTLEYEIGRIYRGFLELPEGQIGTKLLEAIRRGLDFSDDAYGDARREIHELRNRFFQSHADCDAFLFPAAPAPAPKGLASTGDPRYIAPWTSLGGPIVTVTVDTADNGLPIGCLLAGHPGSDATFAVLACRLAAPIERVR
ncbi:MAG: amidase [Rhodospirillales bacterium]